jgi:predicted DNA-binding transcriptional regulator YafY
LSAKNVEPSTSGKRAVSKTERLFGVLDALRRHRIPVTAAQLAHEQGVSVRTLYRDVQTLLGLGAPIDGEAGIGYLLRPGFFLPPLTFSADELEALILGARWVERQADEELAAAAKNALGKIAAMSRDDLRDRISDTGLWPARGSGCCSPRPILKVVRRAMREEKAAAMEYTDESGRSSERNIWPIVLAYYEGKQLIAAWCCLRQSFRHFRADRVVSMTLTESRFGRPRRTLAREWRAQWEQEHPDWASAMRSGRAENRES